MSSGNFFDDLLIEIAYEIFKYFIPEQVVTLGRINKQFYELTHDDLIWKDRFIRHFPHYLNNALIKNITPAYRQFIYAYKRDYDGGWGGWLLTSFQKQRFSLAKEGMGYGLVKSGMQIGDLYRRDNQKISLFKWVKKSNNQIDFDHVYKCIEQEFLSKGMRLSIYDSKELFHWAILCYQSIHKIKSFNLNINLNTKARSRTPLYFAAKTGQIEIVKYLLENKAQIEGITVDVTPLYAAVKKGHIDVYKALVNVGANHNLIDSKGHTMFHVAAREGQLELLKYLLENISDTDKIITATGKTLLYIAARYGQIAVVDFLLEKGAKVDGGNSYKTPLKIAAKKGHVKILTTFLALAHSHFNTFYYANTLNRLLDLAVESGQIDVVNMLLDKGAKIADDALHTAVRESHVDLVMVLLTRGADINKADDENNTPLAIALKTKNLDMISALLDNEKIDISELKFHKNLLRKAVKQGNKKVVQFLLDNHADVNKTGSYDYTPLHLAAKKGQVDILQALLDTNKTILNAKNKWGETPLDLAICARSADCIFALKRQKLVHYIKQNEARLDDDYHGTFSFFSQRINVSYCIGGYSALEKREAAKALLDALDGKKGVDLQPHQGALTNGVLELVYDSLKEYLPDEYKESKSCFSCF